MAVDDPHPGLQARRRLAERLRRLRVDAGLSTTQLGAQLGWSQAKVSRIETARHGIAASDARAWAETLDTPTELIEELVDQAWAAATEARSWRTELRPGGHAGTQAEFGQLERHASLLRSVQHLVVPGLLQTHAYAAALFAQAHPAGRDAEAAADARLARQQILDDETRRFEWVITEAALWWRPADWQVQAEQIRAVAAAATTRPNVEVRILPLDAAAPTFYHSFTIHDDRLVTADSLAEIRLSDQTDIAYHIDVFTRMQHASLDPTASRAVLGGLAARFSTR
ncbi:MAG: Scr1 family TA system antitoxin-like transcriptional regulator [Egibacteraceae bacterium]